MVETKGCPPVLRRVLSVIILASLLVLACAGTALAAPTWLEPKNLSAVGFGAFGPRVGLDANGQAVTTWFGATSSTGDTTQVSERPRAGEWSGTKNLRVDGTNDPDLAVSPDGTAVVAWEFDDIEGSPLGSYIEAAVGKNGVWDVPPKSPTDPLQFSYFPQVAADAANDAVVVWQECYAPSDKKLCFYNQGEYNIEGKYRLAGSVWKTIHVTTGTSENAKKLSPAINQFGDIAVAWEDLKGNRARVSLKRAGQLEQTHTLSSNLSGSPQVAFAADGTAIAVWDEEVEISPAVKKFFVSASTAAPGTNAWTAPQPLSISGYDAFQPALAIAPSGEAVAVWETLTDGRPIQAAVRAGGAWLPAQNISAEGVDAEHPRLAINPSGAAIAAWRATGPSGSVVQAATRAAGGGWAAAKTLSAATAGAVEPTVAIDPEGNAIAAWRAVNVDERIQVVGFDAAGPRLDQLSIPATGVAGQSLGFSVAPSDAWSALAGTSWSFGDGTVASGTLATHTYSNPGTYQVTVSGSDALGNITSATGSVSVSAGQGGSTQTGGGSAQTGGGSTATTIQQPPRGQNPKPPKLPPTVVDGVARFSGTASVHNGKAVLALRCSRAARCSGLAKLVFQRTYVIGKSRFEISAGSSKTLRIPLGPAALRLLEGARGQQLEVRLEGRGVKAQKVVLGL
jgi:hypothetical protein